MVFPFAFLPVSGEYYIADALNFSNIKFIYNNKYQFSGKTNAYRYDFYLPEYDYYIEYTGMLINGVTKNKIIINYNNKLKSKIKLCKLHNLKFFVSIDYISIIEFINELIK